MLENSHPFRAFERNLPGGGFVAIDVTADQSFRLRPVFRGNVVVERRVVSRRPGHEPPVIATATSSSFDEVVAELLPAARCNATIGAALLRLERRGRSKLGLGLH